MSHTYLLHVYNNNNNRHDYMNILLKVFVILGVICITLHSYMVEICEFILTLKCKL